MSYCWYRVSKGFSESLSFEEKIKACLFICQTSVPQVLQFLPEIWQEKKILSTNEKIDFLSNEGIHFDLYKLLDFEATLSEGINFENWLSGLLSKPSLFIRIRKNKTQIEKILNEKNISFQWVDDNCIALPNSTAIDQILPESSYVVQDASSQKTKSFFNPKPSEQWWDCCSGAGGKSLLLKDLEPSIKLTVSDKRSSILHNLKERFKLYSLSQPQQFVADVSNADLLQQIFKQNAFDNIICDVPCTGSGTWARTPEQLYFFEEKIIHEFSERQKKIAENVLPYLKTGGRLIYITCSVFKEENENVIDYLIQKHKVSLVSSTLINGLEIKADSMFVAVLKK